MRLRSYAHVLLRRDGRIEIAVALVACTLVAAVLWPPASLVGGIVRALVPPAGCAGLAATSPLMYACSTSYAALTLALPMAWVATLYRARTWLARRLATLRRRVPARAAHLLAPVLATAALAVPWAFVHADTGGNVGLVPQWTLPAALATAAYGLERHAAAVKGLLAEFLAVRDRMAGPTRAALAVVPPLALALAITAEPRVTAAALKEQVVALTAFACGYLALAPAHGGLASVIGSLFRAQLPVGLRAALRRALPASGLMLLLLEPSIAYACSAQSSCESVAGYNAAVGIAGGLMALATSALASDIASATTLAVDARSAKAQASYPAYSLSATIPWLPAAAALIGVALVFTIVRPTEAPATTSRALAAPGASQAVAAPQATGRAGAAVALQISVPTGSGVTRASGGVIGATEGEIVESRLSFAIVLVDFSERPAEFSTPPVFHGRVTWASGGGGSFDLRAGEALDLTTGAVTTITAARLQQCCERGAVAWNRVFVDLTRPGDARPFTITITEIDLPPGYVISGATPLPLTKTVR